ncbi:hypothetical protein LLH23_06255 [bacterium]|nr:hypothetical protein [bacterium]
MSSLLGWFGPSTADGGVLQAMAGACKLPQSPLQTGTAGEYSVAATSPVGGSDPERIATTTEGNIVAAFAGYLYGSDLDHKRRPAAWCLQLYQQYGKAFPTHLNGTFAVAIYDRTKGELHLVTDRTASRGLYYLTQSPWVFGSEVKFILEYPGVSRTLNHDRLREFLVLEFLPGTATYYDHIRQVPPASVLTIADGGERTETYWSPRFEWTEQSSLDEHSHGIAAALRNSVRRVCAGHERIGLMLSAGLDSRAIASASETPLQCMTLHVRPGAEVALARRIAGALGYPHHFLALSRTFPMELVTLGSLLGDGMHSFHHAQSWLVGPLLAQERLSLLLNGFGLDALFGGRGLPTGNASGLRRLLPPTLAPTAPVDPVRYTLNRFRSAPRPWLERMLRGYSLAEVEQEGKAALVAAAEGIAAGAQSDYDVATWLPFSNIAKHRSALNISSYGRFTDEGLPFHDQEMLSAFLRLPPQYRFNHRAYGGALRLLNAQVAAIPRSWTCLPIAGGRCGEIIGYYGEWTSIMLGELRAKLCRYRNHDRSAWPRLRIQLSQSPEWHGFLRSRLRNSPVLDLGLLEGDGLRRVVDDAIAGRRRAAHALGPWITLDEWLKHYG